MTNAFFEECRTIDFTPSLLHSFSPSFIHSFIHSSYGAGAQKNRKSIKMTMCFSKNVEQYMLGIANSFLLGDFEHGVKAWFSRLLDLSIFSTA